MATQSKLKKALPIGLVVSLIGYVVVLGPDGIQRVLHLGDPVHPDDTVVTGGDGSVSIGFLDGSVVDLGADAQTVLDGNVFDPATVGTVTDASALVAAMQQAVLAGQDPTTLFAATAAGEAADSEGGHGFVRVERTGQQTSIEGGGAADDLRGTTSVANVASPADGRAGAGGSVLGGAEVNPVVAPVMPVLTISDAMVVEPMAKGPPPEKGESGGHEGEEGGSTGHSGEETTHGSDSGHGEEETSAGGETGHGEEGETEHSSGMEEGYHGGLTDAVAVFAVTLSAPATHDVTVQFTTADGTAIAGGSGVDEADYGKTSGTLTIHAGETSGTIEVQVVGDRTVEPDEYFYVNLSHPTNAVIGDGQGVGTIIDSGHGEGSEGDGVTLIGTPGDDVLVARGGPDTLYGGEGNDVLDGGGGPDSLYGGPGDDTLYGLGGPDHMEGGEGNDAMAGFGGQDVMDGGPGDDILDGGGAPDTMHGGTGADTLYGGGGPDQMFGDEGNDTLYGGGGPDQMYGGVGDDTLVGEGGPDTLRGGEGNDILVGGGAADTLIGGEGNDILTGSGGGDVFRFESLADAGDVIADFKPQQGDVIDISAVLQGYESGDPISDYVQLVPSAAQDGALDLMVNATGAGEFELLATLQNAGAVNLDDLLANGNLVVSDV